MSITVNDYRKHLEDAAARAADEAVHIPVQQAPSSDATTGDEKLDKMVRAMQAVLDGLEPQLTAVAFKGMGAVPEEMMRLCQFEYMYTKGKSDVVKELMKLPAQIVLESQMT